MFSNFPCVVSFVEKAFAMQCGSILPKPDLTDVSHTHGIHCLPNFNGKASCLRADILQIQPHSYPFFTLHTSQTFLSNAFFMACLQNSYCYFKAKLKLQLFQEAFRALHDLFFSPWNLVYLYHISQHFIKCYFVLYYLMSITKLQAP